jgi:hypothetical protein
VSTGWATVPMKMVNGRDVKSLDRHKSYPEIQPWLSAKTSGKSSNSGDF